MTKIAVVASEKPMAIVAVCGSSGAGLIPAGTRAATRGAPTTIAVTTAP